MRLLGTLVILGVVGCSLAAPKPVDWDDLGRKIKEFGNNVRDKVHDFKEKVLPAARDACGFVNKIPQGPPPSFGFYPPNGRGFPEAPGFPRYSPPNFGANGFFFNRPGNEFPTFNRPPWRPTWGSNPDLNPRRPTMPPQTTSTTTTERVSINPFDLNPSNPDSNSNGFNPIPTSTENINPAGNSPTNGFNTVRPEGPVQFPTEGGRDNPNPNINLSNSFDNNEVSGMSNSNPILPQVGSQNPFSTIEQDDMNSDNEIPPFIAPLDENGLDNSNEEIDGSLLENTDFRDFNNRYGF